MKSTIIYLIRHGLTDWNVSKLVQGHSDIPLNEVGLGQAKQVAEELKGVPFEAVYASTLVRALQTAHHLSDHVITDPRLREMCYGKFEGLTWGDFFSQVDETLKVRESLPLEEKIRFKLHDTVESYFEVAARAKECLDELASRHIGQKVAVVAHGGLMKSLLSMIEGSDPTHYQVDNVGYMILEVKETSYIPTQLCRITRLVK